MAWPAGRNSLPCNDAEMTSRQEVLVHADQGILKLRALMTVPRGHTLSGERAERVCVPANIPANTPGPYLISTYAGITYKKSARIVLLVFYPPSSDLDLSMIHGISLD